MYTVAAQCFLTGRLDDGVRYTDAARMVLTERSDVLPFLFDIMIGGAYTLASAIPEDDVSSGAAPHSDAARTSSSCGLS